MTTGSFVSSYQGAPRATHDIDLVVAVTPQHVFSTPEDTILQKLKWAELSGGSEKLFLDALRVYELQRPTLDIAYINRWASRLGVTHAWQRLQDEAQPLS